MLNSERESGLEGRDVKVSSSDVVTRGKSHRNEALGFERQRLKGRCRERWLDADVWYSALMVLSRDRSVWEDHVGKYFVDKFDGNKVFACLFVCRYV